jgi:hypothetical protein
MSLGIAAAIAIALAARAEAEQIRTPPGALVAGKPDLEKRVEALEAELAQARSAREIDAVAAMSDASLEEPKLQIYGFMDMGAQKFVLHNSKQSAVFPTTAASFISGNTNLYFDARPVPGWRALVETRFTLFPSGHYFIHTVGPVELINTRYFDTTSPSARDRVQLGSVIVERAQAEWTYSDALTLIAGHFLTPFGIWNVDHGTPTTISLMLPTYLVQDAIPKQQTGVQALGSLHLPPLELGYRAFVSNGRTTTLFDFTEDKAVGARLYLRRLGPVIATVGASGFVSSTQHIDKNVGVDPTGRASITAREIWAYREWVAGADLAIDWDAFRLRTEGVLRHVGYEDGKHAPIDTIPGATAPNHYEWYAYGIAAYRLHRLFEPYLFVEGGDTGANADVVPAKGWSLSGGFNLHLSAASQIKFQYASAFFQNVSGNYRYEYITTRLVLAF